MDHLDKRTFEYSVFHPHHENEDSSPPDDGAHPFAGMYDSVVQREASEAGVTEPLAESQLVPSGGGRLDPVVQRKMEASLGAQFGDVRVHTDDARATAMGAEAYTVGNDIVFKQGNYDPDSEEGQHRLAHELTHVLQQRQGAVEGTDLGNGVAVSDPGDRHEQHAEDMADRVMGGAPVPAMYSPAISTGGASVQRVVQREASEGIDALKKPAKWIGQGRKLVEKIPGVGDKLKELGDEHPVARDALNFGLSSVEQLADPKDGVYGTAKDAGKAGLKALLNGDGIGPSVDAALDVPAKKDGIIGTIGVGGKLLKGIATGDVEKVDELRAASAKGEYGGAGRLVEGVTKVGETAGQIVAGDPTAIASPLSLLASATVGTFHQASKDRLNAEEKQRDDAEVKKEAEKGLSDDDKAKIKAFDDQRKEQRANKEAAADAAKLTGSTEEAPKSEEQKQEEDDINKISGASAS